MKKFLAILLVSTFIFSAVPAKAQVIQPIDASQLSQEEIRTYISLLTQLLDLMRQLVALQTAQQSQITDIQQAIEMPPATAQDLEEEQRDPALVEYTFESCTRVRYSNGGMNEGKWIFEGSERAAAEAQNGTKYSSCTTEKGLRYQ